MDHPLLTPDQILARTAAFFGQPVHKLTAPGGRGRASFRAWLPDRTVIVTQRPDPARTGMEARLLAALCPHTPHVPAFLGSDGSLVFQEDAGTDRLSRRILALPAEERPALARKAAVALLSIHRAARNIGLAQGLTPQGLRPIAGDDLLQGARSLAQELREPTAVIDPATLGPWFHLAPASFTKCDCRAGNAALNEAGHLRWFDFEDARLGHGPEDFAWLMADETWPLAMEESFQAIAASLSAEDTNAPETWLRHLQEVACLQAIRRIRLIFIEARTKGWVDRRTILAHDRVGTNPHLGESLSESAASFAARFPATAPLVPLFSHAAEVFRRVRIA